MKQFKLTLLLTVLMSMLGLQAFADWDTSKKIEVGGLYYYLDETNQQAQVTSIPYGNYTGDIKIPSSFTYNQTTFSVVSIGYRAFFGCSDLTSVTIPNSVMSIDYAAFEGCSDLTSVTIGNSVTSISMNAFYCCSKLTSVTIPNSVTSIGDYAFRGCSGLASVTIGNSVTSIGSDAFKNTAWYNNQPDGLVYAGKVAYKYKGTMSANTVISIKEGTLGIAGNAFDGCSKLTSVTIPNSVTSIGDYAFRGCSGLTSVTIPNSVTSIGNFAFYNCSGLTSVTIPNSVTSIGNSAFEGCYLTSVTIGNSVTSIGKYAFYSSKLTSVTALNPNPVAITEYVFTNRWNATLYVPKGSKSAYQAAAYWKQFKKIVEIDVTGIKAVENEHIAGSDETGNWYTLDGRRLSGKPTKRGIYIVNGRKVIVN